MNYYKFEIGEREFESRLTTKGIVDLEKKLGTNPLNVLMAVEGGQLPQIGVLLVILQVATKEDGKLLKLDQWYDLYDEFVSEGNSIAELLEMIVEIFSISGLLPKDVDAEEVVEGK